MRVAVIILSLVIGQVLFDLTAMSVRLDVLVGSASRPQEAVGSLVLLACWLGAITLVYPAPGVASWLFALASGAGFYAGVTYGIDEFVVWGWVAVGLALFTRLARWEKRRADQAEWARSQHELAVHAALRSLHETVPELLARASMSDDSDARLNGLVELRPRPHAVRDAARR